MEIARKAIIIACPGQKGQKGYLPGTLKDIESYRGFLNSNLGGAWSNSEIFPLINPTLKDIKAELNKIDGGYSFIVFTGHGFINPLNNKQYIEIKDGHIWIGELQTRAKWQTLILDCCRGHYSSNEIIGESYQNFSGGGLVKSTALDLTFREHFDKNLFKCEQGIIVLFAASAKQAAGEEASFGGYFS